MGPDAAVEQFRSRPLDAGRTSRLGRCADGERPRGRPDRDLYALIVTGVHADGHGEILGFSWSPPPRTGRVWLAFFPPTRCPRPDRDADGYLRRPLTATTDPISCAAASQRYDAHPYGLPGPACDLHRPASLKHGQGVGPLCHPQ
jgi:hypothetical protein